MIPGLVSTIVPVFNRAVMLREAVGSVFSQTWRPIQIIIVDDGSSDETPEAMSELQREHPDTVRTIRQANSGPGVARQSGLDAADGEFIQFLDSDDLLLPEKFMLQVNGLRGDPEAGISYGKAFTDERGKRLADPAQHTGERHRLLFPALLNEPLWPTLAPLYRRETLDAIGPWPTTRLLEDWQFDAQAAELGVKLHYVDDYIAITRNHDQPRLCHSWKHDAGAMRDRVAAYVKVLDHAQRAGIGREVPEMQRFVRSLFWMSRTAGAYDMPTEARRLFELARSNALNPGWDYRLFSWAAALVGWRNAARLAQMAGAR